RSQTAPAGLSTAYRCQHPHQGSVLSIRVQFARVFFPLVQIPGGNLAEGVSFPAVDGPGASGASRERSEESRFSVRFLIHGAGIRRSFMSSLPRLALELLK